MGRTRAAIAGALRRVLFLMLVSLPGVGVASAQASLEYRYGESSGGSGSGVGLSQHVSDGIGMLGPTPSAGTVGGAIGAGLPAPEVSAREIRLQQERRQRIRDDVLSAPLPLSDATAYLKAYNERRYAATGDPGYLRTWSTQDPKIRSQLAEVYFELWTAQPPEAERQFIRSLGLEAVVDADIAFSDGRTEEGAFLYSLGLAAADILVGIDTISGTVRGVYEATTGVNLVTGEVLGDFERGLAVVNVVTLGFGGKVEKGIDLICKAARGAYGMAYASRTIAQAQRIAGAIFGRSSVILTQRDRRALDVLIHASAGPRLRAEQIAQREGIMGSLGSKIDLRSPELFALDNGRVYNAHAGTLTRAQADEIGMAFVGDDFIPFANRKGDIIGFKSFDGTKQYRPPSFKQNYGVQANYETFAPSGSGRTKELSDLHVTIVD